MPSAPLHQRPAVLAIVAGIMAFALYLATIAPGITTEAGTADSGELASTAWTLGVAHPPGYGLYLLLARAAQLLLWFIEEPALRTNLLSAALTAGAAATLVPIARRWQRPVSASALPWWAVLAGAATLAVAPAAWSQAVVTEVYALHLLLTALALLAALRAVDGAQCGWWWLGLALGALAAHHPTGWPLALLIGGGAWLAARPRPPELAQAAASLLAPLLVAVAYLLLRADAGVAWGDTGRLDGALRHLAGRDYHGLWEWSPAAFREAFPASIREALRQASPAVWPLLPVGALAAWRARPPLAAALLAACGALVVLVTVYRAEGREAYLGPVALAFGLAVALGLPVAADWLRARIPRVALRGLGGLAVAVAVAWSAWTGATVIDQRDDASVRALRSTLDSAPPGATLRTDRDEEAFPLWYLRVVRGLRPDVTIEDVRGVAPVIAAGSEAARP